MYTVSLLQYFNVGKQTVSASHYMSCDVLVHAPDSVCHAVYHASHAALWVTKAMRG